MSDIPDEYVAATGFSSDAWDPDAAESQDFDDEGLEEWEIEERRAEGR